MSEIRAKLNELRIDRGEARGGRGPWPVVALVLLTLTGLAGAAWWIARPAAASVRTASARVVATGGGQTLLNASGYVTARRKATVSSKVTAKVMEVTIEEGSRVEEGEVLARLDDTNARLELKLWEARLQASRRDLEETRVRLAKARLDRGRAESLVAGRVLDQAGLDTARAEVEALQARLGSQTEAVEVAERTRAIALQQLEDLVVRAPFAGVVVSKDAQPGEMISPVSAGGGFTRTGIGTIVDMASLEIEVDVNEAYINRVAAELPVTARLDAYPDWEIPCRVIAIVPTADRQKATVKVRIGFDALDPRILPDMGVKVAVHPPGEAVQASRKVVAVPRQAVRERDGRAVVFVVRNGHAERRAVTLGEAQGEDVVVLGGLEVGERVVLEGPEQLEDGDRVKEATG